MITFSPPCLRWKFIAAEKLQQGWPGFLAPHETRYLQKSVTITTTPTFGGPSAVRRQDYAMDRLGNTTPPPNLALPNADFPYGLPLVENPIYSETWEVSETHFKHVYNNGQFFVQIEVTLANPYTIGQLDADVDALIAAVNPDDVPWNTLQLNRPVELGTAITDVNEAIPAQFNYAGFLRAGSPVTVPLKAAAYSAYATGFVVSTGWFPNSCVKVVGYFRLAGDYCLKTFFLDHNQNLLDQTCANGTGSCASPFKVTPPPINPDRNAYIVLTPNGRCGG